LVTVARITLAPPKRGELLGRVLSGAVYVVARAELASQILLLAPASDRDRVETELGRELDPEVPEAADPEDGDEVAAGGAAVSQRVEGGDPGAEERCRVLVGQLLRDRRQRAALDDYVVRVTTVEGDPRDPDVLTADEVAATAGLTVAAVAAEPADADALTGLPAPDSLA
jgi:hypothetical protein